MDKRKLRVVLLGVVGIIILVIGIGAVNIYSDSSFISEKRNYISQYIHHKDYAQLTDTQKASVDSLIDSLPRPSMQQKNARFTQWLVKWVVIPFGLFAILTAALVVSRVISNRIRPSSGPS